MKKNKAIHFTHLRNDTHYEFLWIFRHLLDEFPIVKALVAILYEAFIALPALEKKLLYAARHALDATVTEAAHMLYIRLREFGVRCDTRYAICDTRYAILDMRYAILDTRYSILDTRYSILDTRPHAPRHFDRSARRMSARSGEIPSPTQAVWEG